MAVGFVIAWKSEWLLKNFGGNAWAEKQLGTSGGSRMLYKLIGLIIIIVSALYMTRLVEGIIMATLGRLFMI